MAGMPDPLTAISIADSAADGTRSSPSGPGGVRGPSSPSCEAVAITGTGMVCATAPGTAPRLTHRATPSELTSAATSDASSCQRQVGLGAGEDQQVTAVHRHVTDRQLRP